MRNLLNTASAITSEDAVSCIYIEQIAISLMRTSGIGKSIGNHHPGIDTPGVAATKAAAAAVVVAAATAGATAAAPVAAIVLGLMPKREG